MNTESHFNKPPFNMFPYRTFQQVIDKMEYLGEESSPYEVSPGTDLCISDTYYSLSFLNYLHSFGKVVKKGEDWFLEFKGEPVTEKPYRFNLIADAVEILKTLSQGNKTEVEIKTKLPELEEETIRHYLYILSLIAQKGKVKQISKGWDATFLLSSW